jgi:hypothetical protein
MYAGSPAYGLRSLFPLAFQYYTRSKMATVQEPPSFCKVETQDSTTPAFCPIGTSHSKWLLLMEQTFVPGYNHTASAACAKKICNNTHTDFDYSLCLTLKKKPLIASQTRTRHRKLRNCGLIIFTPATTPSSLSHGADVPSPPLSSYDISREVTTQASHDFHWSQRAKVKCHMDAQDTHSSCSAPRRNHSNFHTWFSKSQKPDDLIRGFLNQTSNRTLYTSLCETLSALIHILVNVRKHSASITSTLQFCIRVTPIRK